jgi:colanic acid biosynthesis glycosyl transferase WcaI
MLERLATKNVTAAKTRLFPNWVDLDRVRPLPHAAPLRAERFTDSQIVVLYSGNLGAKQGLDTVVEAARLLTGPGDEDICFVVCGDGVGRAELERLAAGVSNIELWPLVPEDRLNDLLNVADIHVLPQRADAADLVFPSKLTNMLASGRPVVATVTRGTQVAEILDGCGVVVPPGRPAELAAALRALARDRERRRALGIEARKLAVRLWDKDTLLASAFEDYIGPRADIAATRAAERRAPPPQAARAPRPSTNL